MVAPLPQVHVPFRRQQPLAKQPLGALQRNAFHELLRRQHQHVFDHVGMADQIDGLRSE
jgi:hypothetical protein